MLLDHIVYTFFTMSSDSHHSASDECQGAGKHLCQPWELHQAYEAGKYPDIPSAISFWYSTLGSKVMVSATGLTYQEYHTPDPIIASQIYTVNDRDGQAQACSDLDAHLCTLPELNEAYLSGYRQPDSSQWFYFSIPNRDARLITDGCIYSECYEGVVSNTPRPAPSGPVLCCPVPSSESSSPAMCCPGLIIPRDPFITEELYAKEDRDGLASACSALQAHLCTLAELKEAYLQGYRQPFHQPDNVGNLLWLYFAEPNRDAKLFNDGCGSKYTWNVDECYEGIVANTPRPDDSGRAFCCPQLP